MLTKAIALYDEKYPSILILTYALFAAIVTRFALYIFNAT